MYSITYMTLRHALSIKEKRLFYLRCCKYACQVVVKKYPELKLLRTGLFVVLINGLASRRYTIFRM